MNNTVHAWKEITWQICPRLEMPELDPEAVQCAVFESNPVEAFREALLRNSERFRVETAAEKDPRHRQMTRKAQMTSAWDLLFRTITGDQVYLLVSSRTEKSPSIARMFIISSNAAAGRKWLATKIAYRDGMPTCWCVAVDTAIGKSVDIVLGNDNVLDLQKLYDEIVGEQ